MIDQVEKENKTPMNGSIQVPEEESLLPVKPEEFTQLTNGATKEEYDGQEHAEELKDLPPPTGRRLTEITVELYKSGGETTCGIWFIKGRVLQRFANKKAYVALYGILGAVMSASYAYLNGTITTLEKRFKIPTTNAGIIMVGCDISQLSLSLLLNYYGGRGHRPRWIAFGIYTIVIFCLLTALPHLLYGPGEDSLALTEEYGAHFDSNTTAKLIDAQNRKSMCQKDGAGDCDDTTGNFAPQVILFIAQLISGIGGSIYYSLGVSYMDDNIQKSKTPALVSLSYFMRMLGPAAGYALASGCLSMYISPTLTPSITKDDPRWIGAWWLGWLLMACLLFVTAFLIALFPRSLPRAAARRVLVEERRKAGLNTDNLEDKKEDEIPTSLKDMKKTLIRLITNKTLMCNNFSSVFYILGYMPFWVFMPKYIETVYKRSASVASLVTGAVGLVFSAIGILSSGIFISKFKPKARFLAFWNVLVGVISTVGIVSYAFIGCPVNDRQGIMLASGQMETAMPCNQDCHCDYVTYSPVCSPDGRTFISACHAGCHDYQTLANGTKIFKDCTCATRPPLQSPANLSLALPQEFLTLEDPDDSWIIREGPCPVDCNTNFYIFLVVVCILKFSGATGRTSNFLVSVRCVEEKDKTVSMGLGLMLISMFAFMPSPILFGYFIDTACMVWGKTCSGTGNCWLYNADKLRYLMNFTAAGFVAIGTLFDVGVWYYVKGLKIFDEEVEMDSSPQRSKTQRK